MLHRWLAVILVASLGRRGDVSHELALTSITRARMCELLATSSHRAAARGSGVHRRAVVAARRAARGADGQDPLASRAERRRARRAPRAHRSARNAAATRRSVREGELGQGPRAREPTTRCPTRWFPISISRAQLGVGADRGVAAARVILSEAKDRFPSKAVQVPRVDSDPSSLRSSG